MLDKQQQESWQQFHIRAQAICKALDHDPALIDELESLKDTSHYFVAHRFMKCRYDPEICERIQLYFPF